MSTLRITLDLSDGKLNRQRVKEANGDGEYRRLQRPLCQEDLANFRTGERAVRLLAGGVSDEGEIKETVNEPRPSRRSPPKKKPPSDVGSRPRRRRRSR
jgi:hypothetical protein